MNPQLKKYCFKQAIRNVCKKDSIAADEFIDPELAVREALQAKRLRNVDSGVWTCWHRHRQESFEWPVVTVFARKKRGSSLLQGQILDEVRREANVIGWGIRATVTPQWVNDRDIISMNNAILRAEKMGVQMPDCVAIGEDVEEEMERKRQEFLNSLGSRNIRRTFLNSAKTKTRFDPILKQYYLSPLSQNGIPDGPGPEISDLAVVIRLWPFL